MHLSYQVTVFSKGEAAHRRFAEQHTSPASSLRLPTQGGANPAGDAQSPGTALAQGPGALTFLPVLGKVNLAAARQVSTDTPSKLQNGLGSDEERARNVKLC